MRPLKVIERNLQPKGNLFYLFEDMQLGRHEIASLRFARNDRKFLL